MLAFLVQCTAFGSPYNPFHRRTDVPLSLTRFVRASAPYRTDHCGWEPVDRCLARRVMDRYFDHSMLPTQCCELFCIEGVPAASMLYSSTRCGGPVVDSFHLNKGLLFLFDAGPQMRSLLRERYQRISIANATNRDVFLQF